MWGYGRLSDTPVMLGGYCSSIIAITKFRRLPKVSFLLKVSPVEQKEPGYCADEQVQYSAHIADAIA